MKYKNTQIAEMVILVFILLWMTQLAQSIKNPDRLMFKIQSFLLNMELTIEG